MSLLLAKRKDKAVQKKVQSLLRSKANKKCFDCPAKDPTFVNINLQTFVCPRCACLVREIGFRARLASSGKFTGAEMVELQYGGNEIARKIWLSSYISSQEEPDQDEDVRNFMVQKYYEKKWLDNVLLENHQQKLKERISKSFNEDGLPIETKYRNKIDGGFSRLRLVDGDDDEDFVVHNQIEEIEDLTPEASTSNSSAASSPSSSKFTLNPTRLFSGFSIRRSSNKKNSKTEDEHTSEPSSPVSMTITSTEENENIDFFVTPSVSSNSVSSSVSSKELSVVMTEPTTNLPAEQFQQSVIITTDTNTEPGLTSTPVFNQNTSLSETLVTATVSTPFSKPKEKNLKVDLLEEEETIYQQSSRYSEELPTSKISYSNIIQPVPPAKCARFSAPPTVVRSNSSNNNNSSAFNNIMSELSGLCLEKSFGNVAYSGSVLAPTSTYHQALKPTKREEKIQKEVEPLLDFSLFNQFQKQTDNSNDVYRAIRGIAQTVTQPVINQHNDEDDPWQEFCSSSSTDEEPWQEFCSGSSVDDNSIDENMSLEYDQLKEFSHNSKMEFTKPHPSPVVVNLFEDLDPFAVSRRF